MHNVFVYGSLKQGFSNHTLLQGQKFIGNFMTAEAIYSMQHLGIYPGITRQGNQYIQGELYKVNDACLMQLDALEDNGKTYQRELLKRANYAEPCWMYFLLNHTSLFPETEDDLQKFRVSFAPHDSALQIAVWQQNN